MADPYWADVVFLSGFEGSTPVDESLLAQTVTLGGTAALSTTTVKYGSKALHIAAADDYASVPDHASFTLSSQTPFTIEFWVYATTLGAENILISQYDASAELGWLVRHYGGGGGGVWFEFYEPGWYSGLGSTWSPTLNTWHHVVVDFDGTTFRIYSDGTMRASDTHAGLVSIGDIADAAAPLMVGSANDGGSDFVGFFDEVRFTVGTARYASDSGYTTPTAAFDRNVDLDDEITDGVEIFAGAGLGDVYTDTLAQTVGATQTVAYSMAYPRTAADDIGVSATPEAIKALAASLAETLGLTDTATALRGVVVAEAMRLGMSHVVNQIVGLSLEDDIGIDELLRVGIPAELIEDVGIGPVLLAQHAITMIEELGLAPTLLPNLIYGRTVSETVRIADSLANFFGGDISESLGLTDALVSTLSWPATLSETVGLGVVETPSLVLRVTAADGVELEGVDALRMLYNPSLADEFQITAGYISPGGGFTTWAMNTRTGAITEYSNYEFNSFARLGNEYIGASANGLYELVGSTDDGTAIAAQLKSGFAQWAGSRFTHLKSVYLGVRGEAGFVLKVITGDGKSYHYGVSSRDMRSTKVKVGKGIRTRYIRFELISDGDDFDLDSIEFVPLVAQRRV